LGSAAFAFEKGAIALVQYNADLHFNDYNYNMQKLTEFADQAVANGARIIVFPEGSAYGYDSSRLLNLKQRQFWCKDLTVEAGCLPVDTVAEEVPNGRTANYWIEYAKKNGVYILFNLPEKNADSAYYNTTGIAGPQGYISKYRKRCLYYVDHYYADAGAEANVLQTPYGNFGLITCMDINCGYFDDYKAKGVNAIFLVTDWDDPVPDAESSFSHCAQENQFDIYASDVSEFDGTGKYFGIGGKRERSGLPTQAQNQDGISYHILNY
jgi:predicted amidohydrolase